jgi:hypothetical protein
MVIFITVHLPTMEQFIGEDGKTSVKKYGVAFAT